MEKESYAHLKKTRRINGNVISRNVALGDCRYISSMLSP